MSRSSADRSLKNAAAVIVATALTALAIFGGVQVADLAVGTTTTAPAATAITTGVVSTSNVAQSGTLVCPRTNCTASTCHATTGMAPGH
ncbi:MAG: hypothetical protein HGB10_11185 [Coriobacteriia bacterium]|nr:hypothetical protein [Coriobacteriia bacterium]